MHRLITTFSFQRLVLNLWVLLVVSISGCAPATLQPMLQRYPQNMQVYTASLASNQSLITASQQQDFADNYLQHYFSPWTNQQRAMSDKKILQHEEKTVTKLLQDPGRAANALVYSKAWVTQLIDEMNLAEFPNTYRTGITLVTTSVREVPTNEPTYPTPIKFAEAYPFDEWQTSLITANTPLLVLHTTKDKSWSLVLSHNLLGWVPSNQLAYLTPTQVKRWQTGHYLAFTQEKLSIIDIQGVYRFKARVGMITPLLKIQNNTYAILIAIPNHNGYAVLTQAHITKNAARIFPIDFTANNIAKIANQLIGTPYGWGGVYEYRDCSATVEDFFAGFGIWLPRNSKDQATSGEFISLASLTAKQKENLIVQKAIPFRTLLWMPGHIALYIGQYQGQAFLLQNTWALHKRTPFSKKGRTAIGQVVVTSITLGRGYLDIPYPFIERIQGMSLITMPVILPRDATSV